MNLQSGNGTMRAAVVDRYGKPGVMHIRLVPIPAPQEREVLVRVHSIGLNFADIITRWGVYPGTPKPPFIPGIEFSGTIVSTGRGVRGYRGGERVMGYSRRGSHAEFVTVDERLVGRMPDDVTFEQGAAFPVAAMTAYHGLVTLGQLSAGERVLIHAAAGGVGTAAVQLAKHLGAEVFGTAGTAEKLAVASAQGADHVINYNEEDFARYIRDNTDGSGLDVVFDSVGGPVFRRSWSLLRGMGRYVLFGLSSVSGSGGLNRLRALGVYLRMGCFVPPSLISANKCLVGFNLGTLVGREAYLAESGRILVDLLRQGVFRPVIGQRFSFDDIVSAHTMLQTGRTYGKVVVSVTNGEP